MPSIPSRATRSTSPRASSSSAPKSADFNSRNSSPANKQIISKSSAVAVPIGHLRYSPRIRIAFDRRNAPHDQQPYRLPRVRRLHLRIFSGARRGCHQPSRQQDHRRIELRDGRLARRHQCRRREPRRQQAHAHRGVAQHHRLRRSPGEGGRSRADRRISSGSGTRATRASPRPRPMPPSPCSARTAPRSRMPSSY